MWRWEDVRMWRCEDVRMRRCEDEKVWRWEDVRMRRCEDEKMWRWENVLQTPIVGRTLRSDALGKNVRGNAELLEVVVVILKFVCASVLGSWVLNVFSLKALAKGFSQRTAAKFHFHFIHTTTPSFTSPTSCTSTSCASHSSFNQVQSSSRRYIRHQHHLHQLHVFVNHIHHLHHLHQVQSTSRHYIQNTLMRIMIDFYVIYLRTTNVYGFQYTYTWVCGHESVCHVSVCLLNCLWSDVSFVHDFKFFIFVFFIFVAPAFLATGVGRHDTWLATIQWPGLLWRPWAHVQAHTNLVSRRPRQSEHRIGPALAWTGHSWVRPPQ